MNTEEKNGVESEEGQKTINRIFIGGLIGFALGVIVGLIINPPFPGMFETSADVQGLTIFSWVMLGFIGSVICSILSLFEARNKKGRKK